MKCEKQLKDGAVDKEFILNLEYTHRFKMGEAVMKRAVSFLVMSGYGTRTERTGCFNCKRWSAMSGKIKLDIVCTLCYDR